MTLNEYEKKLKSCNPRLHIKRTASGKAGIHLGSTFICRLDQGELTLYNQFEYQDGFADQYINSWNPSGRYKFKRMLKRGRAEAARILYTSHCINFNQISQLS